MAISNFDFRSMMQAPLPVSEPISAAQEMMPRLIPGGPAAPELCMLPIDADADCALPDRPLRMPGFVELKMDGYRCLYIDGQIWTREGNLMHCASHCLPELVAMERAAGEPMVFDGEFSAGTFDQTTSAFRARRNAGGIYLFDAVPFRRWETGQAVDIPIERRRGVLMQLHASFGNRYLSVPLALPVGTLQEVREAARYQCSIGHEGVVFKRAGSPYVRGKSSDWTRLKEVVTLDCLVLDLNVKQGRIRSMTVKTDQGPCRVGSGIDANKNDMLLALHASGHRIVVEIVANRKAHTGQIRHARLQRIRFDKSGAEAVDA